METTTSDAIEVLNDLIQINNDRILGYERALKELAPEDQDLKALFENMIDQSREARMALGKEVQVLGADMETGTTTGGKIYRAWMDVKATFSGHTRHSILANCERGEDAAQDAYRSAIETDDLPAYLLVMITNQQHSLRESHNEMKALRDSEA